MRCLLPAGLGLAVLVTGLASAAPARNSLQPAPARNSLQPAPARKGTRPAPARPAARLAPKAEEESPLTANAGCYVCHMTFVKDEISRRHVEKKVACVRCHGTSARHANDENVGATKPDRTYRRDEVSAFCRTCHKTHDVPPEKVVGRWLERKPAQDAAVCTDCHGAHHIERAAGR